MVTATINAGVLKLDLSPLHKVLALKGCLDIPLEAIDRVAKAPEIARAGPEGTRNPGTSVPHLINAGSFNSGVKRTFWDVHNPDKAISIWVKGGMFSSGDDRYDQIVVEVANPDETIAQIEGARAQG
jgi:hypothetical protein